MHADPGLPDINMVALHEAAHAAAFTLLGDSVVRASILPDGATAGRVQAHHGDITAAAIIGTLAGRAAEWVAGSDQEFDPLDGDFRACIALFPGDFRKPFAAAWRDTVNYVAHPIAWRAIVKIANALLKNGELTSDEIAGLLHTPTLTPVEMLDVAGSDVLALGSRPYARALKVATRDRCPCGCRDKKPDLLSILPIPYGAIPTVLSCLSPP